MRIVLTPQALIRALLGWAAVLALGLVHFPQPADLSTPWIATMLGALVLVIVCCAFGVLEQAEHLARRLGEPYGTLVLTLSVVLIEVVLICSILLGPGEHAEAARDSVMAVSMIILDLVVGLAVLLGVRGNRGLRTHPDGTRAYLVALLVLLIASFGLPSLIGGDGTYGPASALVVVVLSLAFYALFLGQQIGPRRGDFQERGSDEPTERETVAPEDGQEPEGQGPAAPTLRTGARGEVPARAAMLLLTVVPIVLLSHRMAELLDVGLARLQAPPAISGVVVAVIVFLPETLTTLRAAAAGQAQRVSNLCHGALVSTVGLTIPAVLVIGLLSGRSVVLALSPVHLLLLGASLALTAFGFLARRWTVEQGAAHLVLVGLYLLTLAD